jgi:hypothetical protein
MAGESETAVPATPTPNPYAYDTLEAFCKSAVEGNLENALQLVTEDIMITFGPEIGDGYSAKHEGHLGIEQLLANYSEWEVYDCTVRRFEFNGDEVNLWWTHYSPCMGYKCTASCESNVTMEGEKIQKIVNDCVYEFWEKDTN